jgi:ADP-dependent NAD(P)H-hydrate dehydratase / NAD(P)H-hydrate epimerase
MKILTTQQIREADEFTIKNEPVESADLMERAASAVTGWIIENIPENNRIRIFSGPGNNGGDGLAAGRLLAGRGRVPDIYLLESSSGYSPDTKINLERLKALNIPVTILGPESGFPEISPADTVIDALFGTGLKRPLTGFPSRLIDHLNSSPAPVISIDIPSGLSGDDNRNNTGGGIVRAMHTLSFQFPRLAFLFPENEKYTGKWEVLPIGLHEKFISEVQTPYYLSDRELVKPLLNKRERFAHKGTFGHCLLISGSYGSMGAAVLAATSCLRAGAGLLTVHVPVKGCEIVQTCIPEAMISLDRSETCFSVIPPLEKYDAIGAGPAIGTAAPSRQALAGLLRSVSRPLVLDADALNIISLEKELTGLIPEGSVITPHPGEFDRLAGKHKTGYDRWQSQIKFAAENRLVVVLKGAYTSVVTPDGKSFFNSSGNPGMATAGTGDVLTGIILSLLGQGYKPADAAVVGVYLHGLAGDRASTSYSPEAMIAGDLGNNLGWAFNYLKS